jgi:hypothetical protein
MVARTRARDKQEFIDLINQTLDEIEDLRAAIEYDEEFMGNAAMIVEPISIGLGKLLAAVKSNEYLMGQGDWLDFLNALQNTDHLAVPFWPLLKLILETHQQGYQERD